MTTAQSHQYSRATMLHQWTRSLITAKRQSKKGDKRMKVRSKASNSRRNSWCNSRWRKCKKRLVHIKNRVLISRTSTRSCSGLSFRWRETMISWSEISITSFKVVTLTRLRNKVNITSLQLMPQISLKLRTLTTYLISIQSSNMPLLVSTSSTISKMKIPAWENLSQPLIKKHLQVSGMNN